MPLPLLAIGAIAARVGLTAATLQPLVKPAIGIAKRLLKQTARPGAGSKVTKGPLMLGKQKLYGPARPGVGALRVAGAAGAGIGLVSAHKAFRSAPATQTRPQPARTTPRPSAPSKTERKCCPVGTKRMVCFKRGRTKKRKVKSKKKQPRQLVARSRAKKSRRSRKRKG